MKLQIYFLTRLSLKGDSFVLTNFEGIPFMAMSTTAVDASQPTNVIITGSKFLSTSTKVKKVLETFLVAVWHQHTGELTVTLKWDHP